MATLIIQDAFRPYYSARDGTDRKTARHVVTKEADGEGPPSTPRCEGRNEADEASGKPEH